MAVFNANLSLNKILKGKKYLVAVTKRRYIC